MKLRGKRASIRVALGSGWCVESALVYGPYLALHKCPYEYGMWDGNWRITHIPTGLLITRSETQKEGRLLIEQLLKLDWTLKVALTNGPAVRRIAAEVASA